MKIELFIANYIIETLSGITRSFLRARHSAGKQITKGEVYRNIAKQNIAYIQIPTKRKRNNQRVKSFINKGYKKSVTGNKEDLKRIRKAGAFHAKNKRAYYKQTQID